MANRFLSNLRINDAYTFPDNDGSVGQAIVTDGAGNLTFGSVAAASADSAESTHLNVKNTSGASIAKGTPVYVTGNVGNTDKLEIAPADASNASHMPAIGLLESTLANNGEGFVVQGGLLKGLVTDTIDGSSSTANDTVYVKAGGGLTLTKPTGSTNFIQNIAKVARVHSSNGSLIVSSILRTNDVPNLPEGKIWVGDDNTTVSTIVHLDELNGRVGIGTSSPDTQLHISSVVSTPTLKIESTHPSGIPFLDLKGAASSQIRYIDETGTIQTRIDMSDNGGFSFVDVAGSASPRMVINSSGNVGIGTASPSGKFHIDHGDAYNMGLLHEYVSAYVTRTKFGRPGTVSNLEIYYDILGTETAKITRNYSQAQLQFLRGGTVDMLIDGTGNVGIGTTSPSQKLTIRDDSTTVYSTGDAGTNTGDLVLQNNDETDNNFNRISFQSNSDNNQTGDLLDAARITAIYPDHIGANPSGELAFETKTDAGSMAEAMRIDRDGKVGIGTDSPAYKLDVNGDAYISLNDSLYLGNANSRITSNSSSDILYFPNRDHVFGSVISGADVERMRITEAGNVGIGVSPSTELHVKGSAEIFRIDDSSSTGSPFMTFFQNGTRRSLIQHLDSGDMLSLVSEYGGVRFMTGTGGTEVERMRIDSSGNVGIGTTSPVAGLHVAATGLQGYHAWFGAAGFVNNAAYHYDFAKVGFSVDDQDGADTGAGFSFTTRNGGDSNWIHGYIYQPQNGGIAFGTGGAGTTSATERMRITSGGNVGIGTTSASTKLEVSSTAPSGDRTLPHNVLTLTAESSGLPYNGFGGAINFKNRTYTYGILNSARIRSVIDSDSGSNRGAGLAFDVTNSSQIYNTSLFLKYDGNVGIGTTSPAQKLDVNGNTLLRNKVFITGGNYSESDLYILNTNNASTGVGYAAKVIGVNIQDAVGAANQVYLRSNTGGLNSAGAIYLGSDNEASQGIFGVLGASGGAGTELDHLFTVKGDGNVGIGTTSPSGKLHVNGDIRGTIFYDTDNTAYYVNPASTSITDPSGKFAQYVQIGDSTTYNSNSGTWGARLNVTDNVHARIDVGQDANSMLSSWYAHTGNTGPIFGSMTAHPMRMMYNNSEVGYWDDYRIQHSSSVRAPIFYDSNDTIYYVDPNSTVQAANFRGKVLIGPNNSWSKTLQVGGNGREYVDNTSVASVVTTNGNLHLDSASGFATYINYYDGDKVNFGNGSNGIVGEIHSDGSARFPVFYDYNNTGYYVNPQSLSNMGSIRLNETISSSSSGDARIGKNYAYHTLELKGYGSEMMIGAGSSTMHVNYRYCNNTASTSQTPQDWYWRAGTSTSFSNHYWGIGYGVSSLRAPIFYDYDNTGYYVNPAGKSRLGNIERLTHSTGFLVGSYNSVGANSINTNPIYTIGDAYKPTDTSIAGMYGIGYAHGNLWGSGKTPGWGLYVAANGAYNCTIGEGATTIWAQNDIVAYSDRRVKDNIEIIPDAVEKVKQLNGVTFTRTDANEEDKNKRHTGVIAQDVLKVLPEAVVGGEEDLYSVAYGNMVGLLIEAIKEQQTQIDELKQLINKK